MMTDCKLYSCRLVEMEVADSVEDNKSNRSQQLAHFNISQELSKTLDHSIM